MKVIVIGATGTIGNAIVRAIGSRCEVIPVSLSRSVIKVVSPNWVVDTLKAFNMDPSVGTPVEAAARAYVQALEGAMNGEVLDAI